MQTYSTILGFDFGMRSTGVAVGQTVTKTATALGTMQLEQGKINAKQLDAFIQEWQPELLVVGLPIDMLEQETSMTKAARRFAKALEAHTKLPVQLIDEKLSTREARLQLAEQGIKAQKHKIDALSAQLILQSWLNEYA